MSQQKMLIVRVLHSLLIFVILGVFAYNIYRSYQSFNVITQTIGVKNENELVPPALTFCITKPTTYNFTIMVYNEVVQRGAFLESYSPEREEMRTIRDRAVNCWVLKPPANNMAFIKNPPPVSNVPDLVLTTIRTIDDDTVPAAPLLVNIFDPLQSDTMFNANRFLLLAPDSNRAIQFTRTRSLDLNGKIKRNDVKYNLIEEFRDASLSGGGISVNNFTFRAASFDVTETRDVQTTNIWTVISSAFTLGGVLISGIYFPLIGNGKYKPWGYLNRLIGYYPVENMPRPHAGENMKGELIKGPSNEEGRWTMSDHPRSEEVLKIYLDKFDKAKYSN